MKKINIKKTFKIHNMKAEKMKKRLLDRFGRGLEDSVWMHSHHRTHNLDELDDNELDSFYHLFFPRKPKIEDVLTKMEQDKELKRLRAIILKDAHYMGLYNPHDFSGFNAFMEKSSVLKKVLPFYKIDEFPELIKQFKSMRAKYEKDITVVGSKAWHHYHQLPMPSRN
ncbi:hypothetical protein [Amniculibacterium sp. G2-70]|uniref:hypothetical protein n=1 Tax=Amniculibacterium sp. G2-70 TaxID=2767188 RepID=UPI00165485EE|nr:hypothetical protein [Amniculibacterium sp. G2-70]